MRVMQEPMLRKFWYCVMPVGALDDGPKPFVLLGEKIALWKDAEGRPRAIKDRCLHRTAKLSGGTVEDGHIVCPYHGWTFDGSGLCVKVPQEPENKPKPFGLPVYRCVERYGYVWVALEEPLIDIPDLPETRDPGYRQIHEFVEEWACAPLRLMENSFDGAHIAFVHKNTFGDPNPIPAENTIEDRPDGFVCHNIVPVKNPVHMREALRTDAPTTVRHTANQFVLPFLRFGRIRYPNGLVNILCTAATPIDEKRTQRIQFVLRNDTDAEVPREKVIAFDREVGDEDMRVVESTDEDVPLDASEGVEVSMPVDQPGILMRKKLREVMRHARLAEAS
jgi:phenylpropionate dioxygenase-like ring-hydroxylating dioxygenase large terminal subunit